MAVSPELCALAQALEKRGYETALAATREEARSLAMEEAAGAGSVGWGGSETLKDIGLRDAVAEAGIEVRDHRTDCDVFFLSANAVTADGRIVNIDGNGNRVAASIFGPARVVYVVGRNKLVSGGIDDAIARIRREACPPNARRLGRRTPCAVTGRCGDCDSPDRMCKVTVVFDRRPSKTPTKVILVDEPLGY